MDLPTELRDNIAFMLHRTSLEYELYFDREMHALGLTRSQWLLLAHLYFCDGINQKELGELMGIGKGAIGRLAQKLETSGWIERAPDPHDGRAFKLHIHATARPLVRKLTDMLILETDRSMEGFSDSEVAAIRRYLRRISENIERVPVDARWHSLKKQLLKDVKLLQPPKKRTG